jgi:hypothetical protein
MWLAREVVVNVNVVVDNRAVAIKILCAEVTITVVGNRDSPPCRVTSTVDSIPYPCSQAMTNYFYQTSTTTTGQSHMHCYRTTY